MSDSKDYIILCASKLFLQKSFKEVTMQEIVKYTGLSKGAFYHYFKSKEELFLEVLKYFSNCITRNYESYSKESFYQFFHDYADDTIKLNRTYLRNFENEKEDASFNMNYITLMFDALKLFPEFREQVATGFSKEIDYWTQAVELARSKGEIKSVMSDRDIAETFMYLSDGVGMHMILRGGDMEKMVEPFLRLWDKIYEQIKV